MTHAPLLAAALEHDGHAPAAAQRRLLASTQPHSLRAPASFRGALVAALRAHAGGADDARPALWLLDALSAVAAKPLPAKAVGCALAATPAPTGARSGTSGSCVAVASALALRQQVHELDVQAVASAAREASTLANALARKLAEGGGGGSSQLAQRRTRPCCGSCCSCSACPSSPSPRGSRARSAVRSRAAGRRRGSGRRRPRGG
jgi:hypothetical protein